MTEPIIEPAHPVPFANTSGQGKGAIVPEEIRGWNWGAFGLNWIWGIFNESYLAFLVFIPFVNLIMIFILGAKGNEWAWQNKKWDSVEQFKRVQRVWARVFLAVLIASVVVSFLVSFFIAAQLTRSREQLQAAVRQQQESYLMVQKALEDSQRAAASSSSSVPR